MEKWKAFFKSEASGGILLLILLLPPLFVLIPH